MFYNKQIYDEALEKDYYLWRSTILHKLQNHEETIVEVNKLFKLIDFKDFRYLNALTMKIDALISTSLYEEAELLIKDMLLAKDIAMPQKLPFARLLTKLYNVQKLSVPDSYSPVVEELVLNLGIELDENLDLMESIENILQMYTVANRSWHNLILDMEDIDVNGQIDLLEQYIKQEKVGQYRKLAQKNLDDLKPNDIS